MLTLITVLVAGVLAGAVTGVLLGRWFAHQQPAGEKPDWSPVDPDTDLRIRDTAAGWAAAHGRPGAAGLVAEKLRTMHLVNRRRTRRRWR